MLRCDDYREFCELHGTVFDSDDFVGVPTDGLVYVPLDRIAQFFKLCNYTSNNYVLVSGKSDYGIELQKDKPVSLDMIRWINMIMGNMPDLRYEPLHIPARCNLEECKISDTFSVKMYSYTGATFDRVPSNVKWWFCVNMNVDLPRTTKIPYGVAPWSCHGTQNFSSVLKEEKLYVNVLPNTIERYNLVKGLAAVPWAVVDKAGSLSHSEFYDKLHRFKWILCPEGNGLDSYRVMETLAAGSIPVMVKDRWNSCYSDNLPVILLDKWNDLSYNKLCDVEGSLAAIEKDFWLNKIKEKLNDCGTKGWNS